MNQPLTAEQFAHLRDARTLQMREMSAETLTALTEKMQRAWAALSRDGQTLLVESVA